MNSFVLRGSRLVDAKGLEPLHQMQVHRTVDPAQSLADLLGTGLKAILNGGTIIFIGYQIGQKAHETEHAITPPPK